MRFGVGRDTEGLGNESDYSARCKTPKESIKNCKEEEEEKKKMKKTKKYECYGSQRDISRLGRQ